MLLHDMSPEQRAAIEQVSLRLKEQYRRTFDALASHYPEPQIQKALAQELCDDYSAATHGRCCSRIGVRVNDLRSWLDEFYNRDGALGKALLWRVTIPEGQGYALQFEPNSSFYLRRFWRPHMQDRLTVQDSLTYRALVQTLISFTELRFFRDDLKRIFFRHQDINDDTSDAQIVELLKGMPFLAERITEHGVRSTHFFTTTGEMSCVLMLTKMFEQQLIPNQYCPQHKMPSQIAQYSRDENLLLIGNRRTHPLIRSIQQDKFYTEGWRWRIGEREIEPVANVDPAYTDFDTVGGSRRGYILVARTPSRWDGRVVTILAGNHGRAFEGVAELLTSDDRLRTLLHDELKWPDQEPLPESFQIVFSVHINETDEKLQTGATFIDCTDSLRKPDTSGKHQSRKERL